MATPGDDGRPARERLRQVPTLVWIMLGLLLVGGFIIALVFVFDAPPSWKSGRSLGPPEPAPAPVEQVAPATPTPAANPTDVR